MDEGGLWPVAGKAAGATGAAFSLLSGLNTLTLSLSPKGARGRKTAVSRRQKPSPPRGRRLDEGGSGLIPARLPG